ncbi:hypothetical protein BGZ83_009228 [Gryganskiella cystojenkinii]|nr:hypothetical protein BGZ83_009228 [Gryganskiella cystojenkinii]
MFATEPQGLDDTATPTLYFAAVKYRGTAPPLNLENDLNGKEAMADDGEAEQHVDDYQRLAPYIFRHTTEASIFIGNRFFIQTFSTVFGLAFGNLLRASDIYNLEQSESTF